MLRFVLFTTLAALVLAELEPQPRYLEDSVEERVVGGEVARPNSWPWQISLQYKSGSSFYHTCGGTLIKRGWVMTAAHCVDRSRTWRVVLGEHNINSHEGREQYMSVSRVYLHPNWNSNNVAGGYDIALLRLSTEATLNNYVQLGVLPPLDRSCLTTTPATSPDGDAPRLEVSCLPSSNRPTSLLWTTRPAPAMAGGAALSRTPWSALEVAATLDARVTLAAL
ncbi:hypothetical protein WMY93_011933 [Mugilogobius chulae]|uniref:pancreatic elastase n=1 Tax=Mugilogobius chulae TaxID=88201 RepID=A0AAW0P7G5_9GOBI